MNLLKFRLIILSVKVGNKPEIVTRKLYIIFEDDTAIDLNADSMIDPTDISGGGIINTTIFNLNKDIFLELQLNKIKKIIIVDSRSYEDLVCIPYDNILAEQSNCLVKALKN